MKANTTPITAASLGPEQVAAAFQADYPRYQYHVVEFLTEHLADLSREFGGDLQQMLVLAILGQVYLQRQVGLDAQAPRPELDAAISASRIADVTGIPRQTVRRKLMALETRGWVERTSAASYRLVGSGAREGSAVRRALSDVDRRSIDRVARLFCGLANLLARPQGSQA
jgi:DNA-binding MarR family transcriptional regulator